MISFLSAREKILAHAKKSSVRELLLNDALGCVLAGDVYAQVDIPPFDNSAMDGIVINSSEFGVLSSGPAPSEVPSLSRDEVEGLQISQIIKAGDAPALLENGTCAKIMTGAPMPDGADTVIPVEEVRSSEFGVRSAEFEACSESVSEPPSPLPVLSKVEGTGEGRGEGDFVTFHKPFKIGQHVRRRGEDIKKGELVAAVGTVLNSRTIAVLAALGLAEVSVFQRPRVGIIATGSELQAPGTLLSHGKIFDSNSPALCAALQEMGISAEVVRVADDKDEILQVITNSLERFDILITIGGVSVGDYDHVKEAFGTLDAKEIFHKVAIKPGKPFYFGIRPPHPDPLPSSKQPADLQGEREDNKLIFGLPGNPVSALITFHQFVRPAIYKMMGKNYIQQTRNAIAAESLKGSKDKTDFLRGISFDKNGVLYVSSAGAQGSAMLKSLALSDCVIIIPEDKEFIKEGATVEVELW